MNKKKPWELPGMDDRLIYYFNFNEQNKYINKAYYNII